MILTVNNVRQLQRVETGLPDAVIARAIFTANVQLRKMVGDVNWFYLDALPPTDPLIAGGTVTTSTGGATLFEGLVLLLSEVVFAILATDNAVITGFGTVEKRDEYSQRADYFDACKAKEAHFREGVRQLCDIKGWDYESPASTFFTTKFFRHHHARR